MTIGQRRAMRAAALLLVVFVASGCSYNRFTTQEEAIKAQWAQVENQLQRRSDLIPNLVESVKGFAQQERDVFQAVADARAKMAGATTPAQRIEAANAESSALARLLVVVENYPQLKSNETFARLMDELAGTENRLCDGAHAVQRAHSGIQHAPPPFPVERHGHAVRLPGVPVLQRADDRRGRAESGLRPLTREGARGVHRRVRSRNGRDAACARTCS